VRPKVAQSILDATRQCILDGGYAGLSTRRVAETAGVPLSQIHYHFGSKRDLILAVLEAETERLFERQAAMFAAPEPLSVRWDRACEFLEVDLESGYVRILQEMIAAGWSDPLIAVAVREVLRGWFELLADVARREAANGMNFGSLTPAEVGALMGLPFIGAEAALLLGITEHELPTRSALRKVGDILRGLEHRGGRP
jgi:AcrR family transcriptional regulator